jgi:hypothetical protein
MEDLTGPRLVIDTFGGVPVTFVSGTIHYGATSANLTVNVDGSGWEEELPKIDDLMPELVKLANALQDAVVNGRVTIPHGLYLPGS